MNYETIRIDAVMIVHWLGLPQLDDVRSLENDTSEAQRAFGDRIACLALIDSKVEVPEAQVRDAMTRSWPGLMTKCSSFDLIVVGPGVKASLVRTVIRGMAVVSRLGRIVFIHDSPDGAKKRLSGTGISDATLEKVGEALVKMMRKTQDLHASAAH